MSFIAKPTSCIKLGCATIPDGYFVTLCISALDGGFSRYSPSANSVFVDVHFKREQLEHLYQVLGEYLSNPPQFAVEKSEKDSIFHD